MVITKTSVKELEKIQHSVALFILQLPQSSSQVMGWMEAGLQPIQQRLDTKSVLFAHTLIAGKKDPITKSVVGTTLADLTDPGRGWNTGPKQYIQENAQETDARAPCFPAPAGEIRTLIAAMAD